jgi:hypothetical protein
VTRDLGPPAPPRRRVAALLALATVAAALLRLPHLGRASLWFDETYSVGVIRAGSPGELWERIGATESTPPLFYALTWLWAQLAGDGEAAVRTVSAAASIAAVPVGYAALRRLVGPRAALGAAALLAVAPVLVEYALDARSYSLLVLVGLLSTWAFAALLERDTVAGRARWAVAAAAVIWTHWFGGFLVLAEVVVLLWLRPAAWRRTVAAAAGVLAALAPLAPLLARQAGDERAGFIGAYGLLERLEQLVRHFAMGARVPATALEAAGLALFAGAVAVGAAVALRAARERDGAAAGEPPAEGARALLGLAAVGLLAPLALTATDLYDRFNIRNVLYLLPFAAGLAALALVRLRAVPLALYAAVAVAATSWAQADWRHRHSDWRAAIAAARAVAPQAPVIAATPLGQPVAAHYLARPAAAGPVTARRAVLVVEPVRPLGDRALRPVRDAPVEAALSGFQQRRERIVRGFRIVELRAPAPVALDPAQLPGATLFP